MGWLFSATLLALLLLPCVALGLALERPPYLQMLSDDGVVIRWRTDSVSDTMLRYGASPTALDNAVPVSGNRTEHEVALSGLNPDTLYYYSVGSAAEQLAGGDSFHFFRTAPPPDTPKPFRIWVLGDSGDPGEDVLRVRDSFLNFSAGVTPDLILMLGDNAYEQGTDLDHTLSIFQMFAPELRNAALWPTVGNHELGSSSSLNQTGPYFEAFTLPTAAEIGGEPSGTESYYSFDYANVHFVILDSSGSNLQLTGDMYAWLVSDLSSNTKEWTIATWHHPPYSKGSHDSDTDADQIRMREHFIPLLENAGVDLILTGHSHSYERSFFIDGHYGDSSTFSAANILDDGTGDPNDTGAYFKSASGPVPREGAIYAVVGSSSRLAIGENGFNHPANIRSLEQWGSAIIDVSSNSLRFRFLNDLNQVLDEFQIVKGLTCSDGVDNDGDGLFDLADPGCTDGSDLTETSPLLICDDAIDNDGDGLVDTATDPGCDDVYDTSEQSLSLTCDNGLDDDGDTFADMADPGCRDALDASERTALFECDDGLDNDMDGFTDSLDPQCRNPLGTSESAPTIETISILISTGSDDVEERISRNGSVQIASSDLELGVDDTVLQAVGLRFQGVPIPPNATVQSAFLQFTVDETNSDPATLTIAAQASDNAPAFSEVQYDVTARSQTSKTVTWNAPNWPAAGLSGQDQRTPDLSGMVQEIIDRPGWDEGSAMVFVITGTGTRTAEASTGAEGGAPLLSVTFVPEPLAALQELACAALLLSLTRARLRRRAAR